MRKIELIKLHLHKFVEKCDSKDIYILMIYLQDLDIMFGYAIAILQAFEDNKIGVRSDQEVSLLMSSGEYDRMFDEWLNEEI